MLKVSVIVAIYQAELYLYRCLESLQRQTLQEIEILLIDDGSKDSSGNICDEYVKKNDKFKVIHKKNEGVSSARQMGLNSACGEYVIHVDPDDWVDENMLRDLYEFAKKNNSDLVICDYYQELNGASHYVQQKPKSLKNKDFFYELINNLHGSCWNKLVRRSCFFKYNIQFPINMTMWEDKYVNLCLAANPISVAYFPKAYYHYDESININGAVRSWTKKKLMSQIYLINWLDSLNNPVIKKEILTLKKMAKKTAFFTQKIGTKEFRNLYPEIKNLYKFNVKQLGRFPFLIFIAENFSLTLARFLQKCKDCVKKYKS